jgi:glycerol-3-phosphate dehydrogenase (NAD(P)+)
MTKRIGVIGAGSWGTALSKLLAEKGYHISLWAYEKEVSAAINEIKENPFFLKGIRLPENIKATNSIEEALKGVEIIVVAVPSHVMRSIIASMRQYISPHIPIVSATKGIENETLMMMSDVIRDELGFSENLVFLSGPSFAREVALRLPTAVSVAARKSELAKQIQSLFVTDYFRVYTTDDIIGLQLGGALKNVIAIAAGACDGLGFGCNSRAALITRGLAEITRLGVVMGANPLTFAGLAGMGDLVLTCTSSLSRNWNIGFQIAQGKKLPLILKEMKMVAEGIRTSLSTIKLAEKFSVEMPITYEVFKMLYQEKNPKQVVSELMARELKPEQDIKLGM